MLRHKHRADEHDDVVDGERRPDDRYPNGGPRALDDDGRYTDDRRPMSRDMAGDDRGMVRDDRGTIRDERRPDDDRRRTDIDTMPPPPARAEEVTTERTFSIGQLLILLAGAGLLALGIVAVVRGKLDGPLSEPVVEVLGFNHTSLLGLFEMGAGVLLLLAGLRPGGRMLAGLVGALLIVAGALILAELDWTQQELGTEQSFGWVPIGFGALTLIAAYVFPAKTRHVTEIR